MFDHSSIEQYHAQLQEGVITCEQAVNHYLQRIQESSHLNAFVEVYADEALARARELDQSIQSKSALLPLHGVVIGIKDVIAHEGHHLTAASAILKGFKSIYSATAIERLLQAGAIIIGSLNCDEFAMGSSNENSAYGRVLNAADNSRVPGGSSGGSAVAVQAGLCMLSLGSDTGGSVRQPADFCGIIGLKPSYGRISRYGLIAYASSFDQIGIFGQVVADVALALAIMAGDDGMDSTVSHRPVPAYQHHLEPQERPVYRFAYFEQALLHPALDPEISRQLFALIDQLRAEGHQVEAVPFDLIDYIVPAYYVLTTAEASSNLSRYDGVKFGHRTPDKELDLNTFYEKTRAEGFGIEVKRRIMLGTFVLSAGYYDAYFSRAQRVRQLLCRQTEAIFENYDFIIMPTSPSTAFPIGDKTDDPIAMYLADIYTVMANLVGIPAISLPIFRHSNGLPFGLQVMAARFEELPLLQVSQQLVNRHRNTSSLV